MTLKIPSSSKILCTPTLHPHAYSPLSRGGCSHFPESSPGSRFLTWGISVYFHQHSHPLLITFPVATSRPWRWTPRAPPDWLSGSACTSSSPFHCAPPIHLAPQLRGSALCSLTQVPTTPLVGRGSPRWALRPSLLKPVLPLPSLPPASPL